MGSEAPTEMSIRRLFQIVTFSVALALSFSVVSVGNTANACDPSTSGGFC